MDEFVAQIFVSAPGVARSDLAAQLIRRTSATAVSETIGRLGAIEFEVRNNPDSSNVGGPGASWLYFPIVVECYSDPHCLTCENCNPKMLAAIELVLGVLDDADALFVTSSSFEPDLAGNGRNRPLDD